MVPMLVSQFPDLGALYRDQNAFLSNIEKKLGQVVADRAVRGTNMPHKFMNLQMAWEVGLARYNAAEAEGEDPSIIAALGQWLDAVKKQQTATGADMGGAPPGGAAALLGGEPTGAETGLPPGQGPPLPGETPLSGAAPLPTTEQAYV